MQRKIEEKANDYEYINNFFEKIFPFLLEIINDQFGNYLIQKLFETIRDKNLIAKFFNKIRPNLYTISINVYGTRFFQKALECLGNNYSFYESQSLNEALKELFEKNSFNLILDINGTHVIQKIIMIFPKNKNQFIFEELSKISFEVATVKQGGNIFQKAFDVGNLNQKKLLVFNLLNKIETLINDEYGNFIIQQIILLKESSILESILNYFKDNLLALSKRKYSSNVIDKVNKENKIILVYYA